MHRAVPQLDNAAAAGNEQLLNPLDRPQVNIFSLL